MLQHQSYTLTMFINHCKLHMLNRFQPHMISCTSMPNPICVTGNAIHESHCNPTINARRRKQRCAEPELYPFFLSFGAMLCAGICDQRWKWLQSFVISSSKHEMCSHVFHLSSLYHFRAQSQWLKGDGMQEVKITLFNTNSGDESWSSTLIDHLALPSPPLAAAEVWSLFQGSAAVIEKETQVPK